MVIIYNIVNLMKMSDDQKKKGGQPPARSLVPEI